MSNKERAQRALDSYMAEMGASKRAAISGLFTGLMHLCGDDYFTKYFDDLLSDARSNHWLERQAEKKAIANATPGPAGLPPPGWEHADESYQNTFNKWGDKPFSAVFQRQEGGVDKPVCHLAILWDGDVFRPAHGSMAMDETAESAEAAAQIALQWHADWEAETHAAGLPSEQQTSKKPRSNDLGM